MSYTIKHNIRKTNAINAIKLEDLKAYLKITGEDDDLILNRIIAQVSALVERRTNRALLPNMWQLTIRDFIGVEVVIPNHSFNHVESIETIDVYGNSRMMDPHSYIVDGNNVLFHYPPFSFKMNINYWAGTDEVELVEADLYMLMIEHAAYVYENRGSGKRFPSQVYNDYKSVRL